MECRYPTTRGYTVRIISCAYRDGGDKTEKQNKQMSILKIKCVKGIIVKNQTTLILLKDFPFTVDKQQWLSVRENSMVFNQLFNSKNKLIHWRPGGLD